MERQRARQRNGWLGGFGGLDWRGDDRAYAALLDTLTRDLVDAETAEIERMSTSRRSMEDVRKEQEQTERDEFAEARAELDAFRAAILDIRARAAHDNQMEVAYDSATPEADERADLLIQYLVRPGYAEVRTEEPDPGHYVYYIRVDWDRLQALATEIGQPLPA